MWQAVPISDQLFGFQPEVNKHDAYAATAYVKESAQGLEIQADIHMPYIDNPVEYEELLDTIRYFAEVYKNKTDHSGCMIRYSCKGMTSFEDGHPLPTTLHPKGGLTVDAEFSEEFGALP